MLRKGAQLSDTFGVRLRGIDVKKRKERKHAKKALPKNEIGRFAQNSVCNSAPSGAGRIGLLRRRKQLSPDIDGGRRWRCRLHNGGYCLRGTLNQHAANCRQRCWKRNALDLHGSARREFQSDFRREHPVWQPSPLGYVDRMVADQYRVRRVRFFES